MDKQMMSMCGTYCGECQWKEPANCPGCIQSKSQMFWGQCQVAKCAIEKNLQHCGSCAALPCENLRQAFDNPEHGDNGERLQNLKLWTEGKEAYLSITKKNK